MKDKANSIRIRGEFTPITVKRPYVSQSIGRSLAPSQLPKGSKKYRPDSKAKAHARQGETKLLPVAGMHVHKDGKGNVPAPKQAQLWKRWSVSLGKYVYAYSYGGKGWVKA